MIVRYSWMLVSVGWIRVGVCWTTRLQNIARILHKIAEYYPKLSKYYTNYPSAQGTPHPEYNSLNHCHHPTPYSQQKRMAYSASTFSTPIILFFVASRSCLVSCQSDSVIVAICSLKSHRSRF